MKNLYLIFFLIFTFSFTQGTQAQLFDKLKKKAEDKIVKEAEKKVDDLTKAPSDAAQKPENVNNPADKEVKSSQTVIESEKKQQVTINSKYDFIPGEKVIFFDDFTAENIGDFPLQWNTTGSGEVVTINQSTDRWFKMTNSRGIYTLMDPLTLPENYTIEFDIIPQKDAKGGSNSDFNFYIINTTKPKDLKFGIARPGGVGIKFNFSYNNYYTAYYSDGTPNLTGIEQQPKLAVDKLYRMSIWVQKERIRLYIGDTKLFDLPKAMAKNVKYNMIRFDGGTPMISNFRVATGLPDMRSKLLSEGKLVSYGIYFDTNKDQLKPQSYPSIKEIASILKDNPDVKIKIVGHTDGDGDDKSNLELSKRRSASVKNALINDFGIEASRIETDGKGEIEPVAPNDNLTNKALNRRVEFIKL